MLNKIIIFIDEYVELIAILGLFVGLIVFVLASVAKRDPWEK